MCVCFDKPYVVWLVRNVCTWSLELSVFGMFCLYTLMCDVLILFFWTLCLLVEEVLHLMFICVTFFQVLGNKPELPDGNDDDDTIADMTNRKMAKLYMVSSFILSALLFLLSGYQWKAKTGRDFLCGLLFFLSPQREIWQESIFCSRSLFTYLFVSFVIFYVKQTICDLMHCISKLYTAALSIYKNIFWDKTIQGI